MDDELLMRLAVARLLRGAGGVCVGAATHDEAIVLLAFEPVLDLAILDFEMPDGEVGRLVRRLHWQRPALPLVGTSGSDRRSEFATRGVARSLPKPWGLDDLIRVADWSEAPGRLWPAREIPAAAAVRWNEPDRIHTLRHAIYLSLGILGPSLPE